MNNTEPTLRLRAASIADAKLLFDWANDPVVRATAFATEDISWEDHINWLKKKLRNETSSILIAETKGQDQVGQIRFDLIGEAHVIVDVHTSAAHRGKAYGSKIIFMGTEFLRKHSNIELISAYVKMGNDRSFKAFMKAGFTDKGTTLINDQRCHHLIYQINLQDNL